MNRSWYLVPALALVFCGCDTFFEVFGTVTRCSDGEELVGVRAALTLDSGGVSDEEEAQGYSKPDGTFYVGLNEPPDVAATLRLDKPGYVTYFESFEESPSGDRSSFCLEVDAPAP